MAENRVGVSWLDTDTVVSACMRKDPDFTQSFKGSGVVFTQVLCCREAIGELTPATHTISVREQVE